jgi:hypothetical protein
VVWNRNRLARVTADRAWQVQFIAVEESDYVSLLPVVRHDAVEAEWLAVLLPFGQAVSCPMTGARAAFISTAAVLTARTHGIAGKILITRSSRTDSRLE